MFIYLKRSLARLLDYGLFYFVSIFVSMMLPFSMDETFYFSMVMATPLLWAPLEAIFLKKWGTTPGKKLFELSVPELTWKESFKRAFFLSRPRTIAEKKISFWRYLIALMITCSGGSALFFGKDISEVAVQYEQTVAGSGWIKYISDEGKFSVNFPKKPEVGVKTYENPDGEPINLNEVKIEKEAEFSVSYLDLPKKWKLFSSSTLLKGAMKVVMEHMPGTEMIDKNIVKHKNYPAMDFRLKEGENVIEGRLILVGNTLYRLMVVYYPDTPRSQQHETFLNSFDLKN
jgi:hypothetical protein